MRIGVNTRFLIRNKLEGIGWFTFEVMKRWVQNHPEHDFVFFFDRPYSKEFLFAPNVKPVVVYPPARAIPLWKIWFNWSIPYYCKKEKVDVFVSPDAYASLRLNIPQLVVIHDLAFEHESFGLSNKLIQFYQKYTPLYVRKAKRIATVSQFSKQDIHEKYQIDLDKIDVVYNGYNEEFKPLSIEEKEAVKSKYTGGKPYFISLGAIHPRKNGLRLLQAFERFKEDTGAEHQLLFVGRKAWSNNDFENYYAQMKFKDEVKFLGHLSIDNLKNVLASATVMFYPSLFEGFGIPIIEAYACGVPVVTSNTSSMQEIGEGVADLVDPYNEESIFKSMVKLYNDFEIQLEMIDKGFVGKSKYSWAKTADALWDSLMKIDV